MRKLGSMIDIADDEVDVNSHHRKTIGVAVRCIKTNTLVLLIL